MTIIRVLIQGTIVLAIVLGAISGVLRQRKVLAVTGASLGLLAAIIGGGSTPLPDEVHSRFGLGLDWFLLDLFVMTVVFLPVERFWPLHPDQKTFRPQWTTDLFYFVATHLPAQLITLVMVIPATYASKWLAIPWLAHTVGSLPFLIQLPLAIVVADLSQYVTHRAFHRIPLLWRFHAIHHSIETMDWVAGSRSHYVDILLTRGLILVPMTIVRFLAGGAGRLSRLRVLPRHVLPHRLPAADDLAGAVLRDRALSPLASRGASRTRWMSISPSTSRSSIACSEPTIFRKTPGRQRYGLVGGSVPRGFFAQLLAPFKRDAA